MNKFLIKIAAAAIAILTMTSGCDCKHGPDEIGYDKVMILYSAGHNSISSYLRQDIADMKKGFVPSKGSEEVILIMSHQPNYDGKYSPTSPVLINLYKDKKKKVVMDTVAVFSQETIPTKASDFNYILSKIYKQFPAKHYGMVFSSHASGWMPKGYYENPESYDNQQKSPDNKKAAFSAHPQFKLPEGAVPYYETGLPEGSIPVKSIGSTVMTESGNITVKYELDIDELSSNLPMHLDYMLLDACLAGGIETAYQLKDKCDIICFSSAEVLAEGFNYSTLATHLLEHNGDVGAVAKDYFAQHAAETDPVKQSATVSVVDCKRIEGIATVCSNLFDKYRASIETVDTDKVQPYFRGNRHWFYDLEDILVESGISNEEKRQLETALDECIIYKAATEYFMRGQSGFKIDTFSGFSMYLPCNGSAYLDDFYRTLEWNKATKLVD